MRKPVHGLAVHPGLVESPESKKLSKVYKKAET